MSEAGLQQQIVSLATMTGWWVHHHYDSRRSTPGFPDLAMVRGNRLLFADTTSDLRKCGTIGRTNECSGRRVTGPGAGRTPRRVRRA